jgi:nucleoside 2-deoxyribosyltransferase
MKRRLNGVNAVLALLDGANPNVFLEIGYAWGLGKPTLLVVKKGSELPFDVRGQRCIQYTSISNLRALLTEELKQLKVQGVLADD